MSYKETHTESLRHKESVFFLKHAVELSLSCAAISLAFRLLLFLLPFPSFYLSFLFVYCTLIFI